MVFKYGVWPNEGTGNAKVLADPNNRFTLSERKFAESVLRCCPCVFRCRRAIGIEDDQTTAITATNNQPENITPVISLTINRSPETIEKVIIDENERNNKNIEKITESIIIQVQNTNNQLYQNQFPGQEIGTENQLPNGILEKNNREEYDRTSERDTKISIPVLEQNPNSESTYQSDLSSLNTPNHCTHPKSENVEIQTSSDEKLPIIKNRPRIFNQSVEQGNSSKSDKHSSDELISVHSRLIKSANATSSKYKTSKLHKKTFKSLPSINRPKVPLHLHSDSFKRSESIESLTDESFVEKGSSSAIEQNGNVDNDLTDAMAKSLETEEPDERIGSSSSKSTVRSELNEQLSENQKPSSRINSPVSQSGQSLISNRAASSQSNIRTSKSENSEEQNVCTLPKKVRKRTPAKQNAKKQITTKSKIHLQQCFTQLESKDWEEIIKGLNNLSQIARQEPEILDTCPSGTISRLLGRHIKSLRSQVSRTACSVVGDIFNCSIRVTDQDLDDIIKPLLHRTADTNKFLRADSNIALDRIVENFPPHRTISIIVLRGATHQNAVVRATTGRLLNSILNTIGPMNVMLLQRDIRNKYLNTSAKLLTDGNLNARNHAKDIFRQIVHFDAFRKALSDAVSESTIRHIDKTLKSL